jgi:hypothetical protein
MKRIALTLLLPLLATAVPTRPSLAQGGGMMSGRFDSVDSHISTLRTWRPKTFEVAVESTSGEKVVGTLALRYVLIQSDFGSYAIEPEKVQAIRFKPDAQPLIVSSEGVIIAGNVATQSGQEIHGQVFVQEWRVKTELGSLMLAPGKLKSLTLLRRAPDAVEPGKPNPPAPAGIDQDRPQTKK